MKNFLNKLFTKDTVEKSGIGAAINRAYDGCDVYSFSNATYAGSYYATVSALYTGISSIADAAADYEFMLVDETSLDAIVNEEQNEFVALVNNPNPYESKEKFLKKLISNYKLEGEAFLYVEKGDMSGKVVKMVNLVNSYVTRSGDLTNDGFPTSYKVSDYQAGEYRISINPTEGIVRYVNILDPNKWLIPINDYAPGGELYCPVSAIDAITSELMQFVQGNTHNNSLLKNGTAIGTVFNYEGELTEEQFKRVNRQLRNGFQGAVNAGRPIVSEGKLKSIQNVTMTNRDMEYRELREMNEKAVYKALKLPLSLYMDRSMTFDNVRQGRELLHEQATIPAMNFILGEISRVLLPEGQRLIVNEFEIPALRSKRLVQANETAKGGYLTINEVRAATGYAPIAGGDVLINGQQISTTLEDGNDDPVQAAEKARIATLVKNGVSHEKAEEIVNQTRRNCSCC